MILLYRTESLKMIIITRLPQQFQVVKPSNFL